MKKKMNFRKSLFIGMAVCSSMIFTNNFEVMADNSTNYKDMSEYAKYEGVIADTQASLGPTPLMQATVALYDIDQDGTKELSYLMEHVLRTGQMIFTLCRMESMSV